MNDSVVSKHANCLSEHVPFASCISPEVKREAAPGIRPGGRGSLQNAVLVKLPSCGVPRGEGQINKNTEEENCTRPYNELRCTIRQTLHRAPGRACTDGTRNPQAHPWRAEPAIHEPRITRHAFLLAPPRRCAPSEADGGGRTCTPPCSCTRALCGDTCMECTFPVHAWPNLWKAGPPAARLAIKSSNSAS